MRVDTDRARNGYRGRKSYDRLKYRNQRTDDYHSRVNGNPSARIAGKSRYYSNEEYSLNRIGDDQSNYFPTSSSRFDRQTNNNRDIYSPLLTDQSVLSGGPSPTVLYYNSSQTIRDRGLSSPYIDSERNRYPSVSSSTYRRDNSPPPPPSSCSYRDDYIPRNNGNDRYIRDKYRSPTPPISMRSTTDSYNDMYQPNEYNNRSERYDISLNRNGSSRDYAMTSIPSPYRKSSAIPISSSSSASSPPLTSPSAYVPRDQYEQAFPSVREIDYRSRNYGLTTSIAHREIVSAKSSDRYYDDDNDYRSSFSHRNPSNLKRSRSNFLENVSKRPMRR